MGGSGGANQLDAGDKVGPATDRFPSLTVSGMPGSLRGGARGCGDV